VPWSLGSEWSAFRPVFIEGNWWYDEEENTLGYRFGDDAKEEWGDTTWEFHGPDEYPAIAAEIGPGWTAKAGEKAMHDALVTGDPHAIDLVAGQHPQYRNTADTLAGLLSLNTQRSYAGELLDRAVASGYEPQDDPFIRTYLPGAGIVVPISPGVVVPLPLMRTAVALAAAELHQAADEYERAIEVLEPVDRTTHVILSLTELLCDAGRYAEAVETTEGIVNTDDVSAITLAYRARAQGELGDATGAAQTLEAVLGRGRPSEEVIGFAQIVRSSLDSATP
jgi:tetratricopeptide (TPR) repeat protein